MQERSRIRQLLSAALACAGCTVAASESVGSVDQPLRGSGPCASLEQLPDMCPAEADWRNHGQYVSCVAHYLNRRLAASDITEEQKGELQSLAAQSDVGKTPGARGPSFADVLGDSDGDAIADNCEPKLTEPIVPASVVASGEHDGQSAGAPGVIGLRP